MLTMYYLKNKLTGEAFDVRADSLKEAKKIASKLLNIEIYHIIKRF